MGGIVVNKKLVIGIISGVILVSLLAAVISKPQEQPGKAKRGEKIGVIYIEGIITGDRNQSGLLGDPGGAPSILRQLKQAREDNAVKAVLIRVNSPGGSAAASQEIGYEIDKIRKNGKKVVVSMGDVAASGGYWIASRADKVIADPATMTGSIGVIMETMNMQELFNKVGISPQTIKSGPYKDIGSLNRPLTPAERDILQDMVNDIYQQFVDVVAEGRKMDRSKVLQLADGRIYTGRQAKKLGLVDELGNFYDAVALTAKLAGIEGEPEIYEFGPKSPFERLFGEIRSILSLNYNSSPLSPREIQIFRELLMTQPAFQKP